jgi:hypothetical protein
MIRDILAALAGIAIAVLIVFVATELNHTVYPPPPDLDFSDPDALRPYIATLPIGAFLLLIGGWVVGTFVGSVIAGRIGTAKPWIYPAIVGGLIFSATAANLIAIPHPLWFSIISLLAIIASAWLATRVAVTGNSSRNPSE